MPMRSSWYRSYLLRCWTEQGHTVGLCGPLRFSLEDPSTAVRRSFATWEALLEFLRMDLSDLVTGSHDATAEEHAG